MAFQFLCPQGHLLQGDESQAGQQCKCPYCETLFVVPAATPSAPAEQPEPEPTPPPGLSPDPGPTDFAPQQPAPQQPASGPDFSWAGPQPRQEQPDPRPQPDGIGFPGPQIGPDFGGGSPQAAPSISTSELPGAPAGIVHVLCPSGHELETPREMLGQEALCPYCQVQFRLRFEDSVEYRKEKQAEQELRELRTGKKLMQWSIAAAVVVVLGVILLIVLAMAK